MKLGDKKNINAILFFAFKSDNRRINRLKLLKLLWLADRIHLNRFGRLILKDNYNALPHGPVPSKTMDLSEENQDGLFDVSGFCITALSAFDSLYFSKTDLDVMNEVWEKYGEEEEFKLRNFSHEFPEWKRFEKEILDKSFPNSYPIIIEDFFNPPCTKVNYEYNKAECDSSRSIYRAHGAVQSILT